MAESSKRKRKRQEEDKDTPKRIRIVLAPRNVTETVLSDASTLPWEVSLRDETLGEVTMEEIEPRGDIVSDDNSLTDLSEGEEVFKETDPMRDDIPIVTDRWTTEEVDALMTALNINRDAVKFHFQGPGGGKDVKRQGWRDVAAYVNDVEDTHRTVKQCRDKASDYTQRTKAKYNKLRYAVATTGKGVIKKSLHLKPTEGKALDYLREEAVTGIPGVGVMQLPELLKSKPSRKNQKLVWKPDRDAKPDYSSIEMKKKGVPNNYRDKNKRRVYREEKLKRKKEHKKEMVKERKQEKEEAKKHKADRRREREGARDIRKKMKEEKKKKKEARREKERKERKQRKEERKRRREEKKLRRREKSMK